MDFRSASCRYKGYDYSSPGTYFITINIIRKIPFFGILQDGKVKLSECGMIAKNFWMDIPDHFENVSLDEFVIMPDHVHGLVVIKPPDNINETRSVTVETLHATSVEPHSYSNIVETLHATSLPDPNNPINPNNQIEPVDQKKSDMSPKHGSLAVIIRSYKSAVSKTIHGFESGFAWQSGYYDHIVRGNNELHRIRKYIRENPANGGDDLP